MRELGIAAGLLGLMMLVAFANAWAPTEVVLATGTGIVLVGLAIGLPTGVMYHVVLRRHLVARGALSARWWMSPTDHHDRLEPEDWAATRAWFYAGAAGFGIVVLGCAVVAVGAVGLWAAF